jgi:N-acetylglucosamine repressor
MARRQLLKAINRAAILNTVKAYGPIARTDIARMTALSPAAVTGLTAGLIDDGLIYEQQEGDSRGGRRPILLALDASGAYVVGVKLDENFAMLVLTDLNAKIIARQGVQFDAPDAKNVTARLAECIRELLEGAHVDQSRVLGIGIGVSGIVDSQTGMLRLSPFSTWHDVPLAELLESHLDYPVYLDNNVNTLTLSEQLYGAGQHVHDFLVITIGRGCGLGIVTHGMLYRGSRGGAGELGHIPISTDGPICTCGKRGCLETFVAEPWLLRRAKLNGLTVATPDDLVHAADAHDPLALDIFGKAGLALGQGISTLVQLFNPAQIIISGEGVRALEHLRPTMDEGIRLHSLSPLVQDVEITVRALNDEIWACGAASLVLSEVFHSPQTHRPMLKESVG